MEQKSYWRQTIPTILFTGIVTLIVGIIVGISVNHFQMREPKLVYYAEDTLPYESLTGDTAIYYVKIKNIGKEAVEKAVCILAFEQATIQQHRIIIDPSIDYSETLGNSSYRVDLPSLNPQESAILSVLATSSDKLPPRPEISLRGNGIVGIVATSETSKGSAWPGILGTLAGLAAGSVTLFLLAKRGTKLSGFLADEQKDILAYLCEIHGLNEDAKRYRNMVQKATYCSESDFLASESRMQPLEETALRRKQVLEDLLKYNPGILKESMGVIHYNIALIAKARGEEKEAEEHLKQARRQNAEIVKKRMQLDPIWKSKQS